MYSSCKRHSPRRAVCVVRCVFSAHSKPPEMPITPSVYCLAIWVLCWNKPLRLSTMSTLSWVLMRSSHCLLCGVRLSNSSLRACSTVLNTCGAPGVPTMFHTVGHIC